MQLKAVGAAGCTRSCVRLSSGKALLNGEAKQLGEEVKLAETRPAGADLSGKMQILLI